MIRSRLFCAAVLLAGMACSTTSSAPETASPKRPDPEAGPAAGAADSGAMGEREREDTDGGAAELRRVVGVPVAELAQDVGGRMDRIVTASQRSLDEVDVSFESARIHAADVFARLARLRTALEEAGFSGGAMAELDKLEQDAVAMNQTSEALRDDLIGERAGLDKLMGRLAKVLEQVAAEVGSLESTANGAADVGTPDTAADSRKQLRELDAEAIAYERSGELDGLVTRSDSLLSRVAVLVSRLDHVERELDVLARAGAPTDSGSTVANQVAAKTDAAGASSVSGGELIVEEDDTQTPKGEIAEITTSKGALLLQFFPDVAPAHVQNFKRLVRDGFYDGLTFHRVLPGYIVQGGCPRGDGFGGPGWQLDNEFNRRPHRRGTLAMARFAHPDSAGSQFFICLDDRPELDGKQTVFGRVIRGEATLSAIEASADSSGGGAPSEDIQIQKIVLRPWRVGDNETSMIAGNPVR